MIFQRILSSMGYNKMKRVGSYGQQPHVVHLTGIQLLLFSVERLYGFSTFVMEFLQDSIMNSLCLAKKTCVRNLVLPEELRWSRRSKPQCNLCINVQLVLATILNCR